MKKEQHPVYGEYKKVIVTHKEASLNSQKVLIPITLGGHFHKIIVPGEEVKLPEGVIKFCEIGITKTEYEEKTIEKAGKRIRQDVAREVPTLSVRRSGQIGGNNLESLVVTEDQEETDKFLN